MNSKGFTLFTALVSFVLIALAFVLIQSMIESERNSTDTIETINEQTEMQNIADLARADALQLFNIGVRNQFEIWATNQENEFYYMDQSSAMGSWDGLVKDFAAAELGGKEITDASGTSKSTEQFATAMAHYMSGIVQRSGTYSFKGYSVKLVINEENPSDLSKFQRFLQGRVVAGVGAYDDPSSATKPLLEPINCDETSCNTGTFYINLDLTNITNAEYNNLPQIVVTSHATGRVIKQPILPRGNIRLYIPLRLFKAIWHTREIARTQIFSFGTSIKSLGLGMCDTDCSVRVSPNGASKAINKSNFPGNNGKGWLCPNSQGSDAYSNSLDNVICAPGTDCPDLGYYDPSNENDMGNVLKRYIALAGTGGGSFTISPQEFDGLKLWAGTVDASQLIKGETSAIPLKKIKTCYNDSTNCPGTGFGTAYCTMVSGLSVTLEFLETRQEYKVNDSRAYDVYKIRVTDSYKKTSPASLDECNSVIKSGSIIGTPGDDEYSCEG